MIVTDYPHDYVEEEIAAGRTIDVTETIFELEDMFREAINRSVALGTARLVTHDGNESLVPTNRLVAAR